MSGLRAKPGVAGPVMVGRFVPPGVLASFGDEGGVQAPSVVSCVIWNNNPDLEQLRAVELQLGSLIIAFAPAAEPDVATAAARAAWLDRWLEARRLWRSVHLHLYAVVPPATLDDAARMLLDGYERMDLEPRWPLSLLRLFGA